VSAQQARGSGNEIHNLVAKVTPRGVFSRVVTCTL
jgi:hypothetical protein